MEEFWPGAVASAEIEAERMTQEKVLGAKMGPAYTEAARVDSQWLPIEIAEFVRRRLPLAGGAEAAVIVVPGISAFPPGDLQSVGCLLRCSVTRGMGVDELYVMGVTA